MNHTLLWKNSSVPIDRETMKEKTLPKLLVNREEADKKIQERIKMGQKFRDQLIDSEDEYELVGKKAANWSTYNKDLLVKFVHGHDEGAKHKIARFIVDLDLIATILDELPIGHTIIDKFEEHADDAGFAILLLTADDLGAPKDQQEKLQPRARQNVILELGYFLATLGRKRIGVLYEEGVELPSDIEGLEYILLDNADGWKIKLAKGMRAAGFTVDLNKI